MRKIIIYVSLVIIAIGVALFLFIRKENYINNKISIDLNDNDNDNDNVKCINVVEETEGGYRYYETSDDTLIKSIIDALNDIEVYESTDVALSDSSKTYIIEYYSGKIIKYCFEGEYYFKDGVNYKISNKNKLDKIQIPVKVSN